MRERSHARSDEIAQARPAARRMEAARLVEAEGE